MNGLIVACALATIWTTRYNIENRGMPPGYVLQSNGEGDYRYCCNSNGFSYYHNCPEYSKWMVMSAAWREYNDFLRANAPWLIVTNTK
jgi:hypothetical protein